MEQLRSLNNCCKLIVKFGRRMRDITDIMRKTTLLRTAIFRRGFNVKLNLRDLLLICRRLESKAYLYC